MKIALAQRIEYLRSRISDRVLGFKPSIETLTIGGHDIRFFYATAQAVEWYQPLSPHLYAEFEWLMSRLNGQTERIIDAGAYHGLYTLVFASAAGPGSRLAAVDPVPSNCAIIEANLALNRIDADVVQAAVSDRDAPVRFTKGSCGRIDEGGAVRCDGRRLPSIMADATVVKLDIEGAEFTVLPEQIDQMPEVHTWIVEIHPGFGFEPGPVIDLFRQRSYALYSLNREAACVEPLGPDWTERTALIAIRPRPHDGP